MCGAATDYGFITGDRNRRLSNELFIYCRCNSCGTFTLATVPPDLARYYPSDYYAVPSNLQPLIANADSERYKLEIIRRFVTDGRLVEIGPGIGAFSLAAKSAGFDTSAIEMDADCCEFLRSRVGIPVEETDNPVAGLASSSGPVAVVAMWHVIEHVPNPRELLAAAISRLAPGGIVAIAAPNPEALQFRLWARRWTHVDAPRHLSLISAKALVEAADEFGAEPVLLTMCDPGTLAWNRFGWRETLAGYVHDARLRFGARLLGSVVARLFAPVERRGKNGTTYTIILRKRSV